MTEGRFAVYFVPAAFSALYRFGAAVLGYDCYTGADVPFPVGRGVSSADWAGLTAEPRKYGFHGTLKAPFRLRDGTNQQILVEALEHFAARRFDVPQFVPRLKALGGFVAIVPPGGNPVLSQLADACVTEFEPFRAPLSAEERERRMAAALSETQIVHLDRWGYPYVFNELRFHMTLTGPLPPNRQTEVLLQLEARFAAALGNSRIAVDRLALLHQEGPAGRFKVIRHVSIGDAEDRSN